MPSGNLGNRNKKGTKNRENKQHSDDKDDMEEREATTHESQHILSQAYKVMVDVPDPPREELADDEGKKVNSGRREIFANCQNAHCKRKL